ncbi:hypothetical protein Syn7803US116_160 [Synechococcus phage ACG-2014d]|uniref:DUF7201 domain-containing protein n=1 Tax=Synechococcus phage ACG-2014d TaxID=1493509 RepID=A0A0E3HII7_9CAUD|nr:hypothetical protein Syn7803US116_160 [Synechococcus phage ACG-2014d]
MAFGLGKLNTLEAKLDIYEDLSKEMLDKLERAVDRISENSNRVAIMLAIVGSSQVSYELHRDQVRQPSVV